MELVDSNGLTLGLPLSTLFAFLFVLGRVGGLVAFLPLPALRNAPQMVRAVLAMTITFALFPVWPQPPNTLPTIGELTTTVLAEMGFGFTMGLAVNLLTEGFEVAAQLIGVQAGYGYATTIDPTSQADAGVLQVISGLMTGLLIFTLGVDRQLFRILAASFEKFPAGSWTLTAVSVDGIVHLGSGMFSLALRLAMPMIALLLLIDLSLALLGRMQQQLQMLSLAFPLKMLAALLLLAVMAPVIAHLFESASRETLAALWASVDK